MRREKLQRLIQFQNPIMKIVARWFLNVISSHFHKAKYARLEILHLFHANKSQEKCLRLRQSKTRPLFTLSVATAVIVLVVGVVASVPVFGAIDSGKVNVRPANLIWERAYGDAADDRAFSAAKAGDGYLIVGSSQSVVTGKTVGWILRLDPVGIALWNRTFPTEDGSEFRQVLGLTNGFLLVGNVFLPSGDVDGYVLRTDAEGVLLWNITLGGKRVDKLFSAAETTDGFVLAGLTYPTDNGESNAWVVKIDGDGKVVWDRTFGGAGDDAARAVVVSNDNCFVAGYANPNGGENYDFLLMKLDASGEVVWNRTYGGTQSDKAYALTEVSDGLVMVGDTRSKGMGDTDAWTVKVDFDGNIKWETTAGGEGFDMPTCVTASMDGGFLVGGFTFSFGNGKRDFWLFKLDGSGNELWSCTQGKAAYEEAYAVLETAKDEFVMAGWVNYAEGGPYDYYIVKISPSSGGDWWSSYGFIVRFASVIVAMLIAVIFVVVRLRKRRAAELKKN